VRRSRRRRLQLPRTAVSAHTRRRDTLASMFLNSLRRGGALEAALAARCLGLEAVTLGAGEECEQ
jgi:Interferon-related developmental regulator (IFRD)